MRIKTNALFFLIVFFSSVLNAEEVVTLSELEQEAVKNNPEIGMATKTAEAAGERKSLASALPDPMIGYEIQNVGPLTDLSVGQEEMSMKGVVISQQIPFPGKRSAMGRAAAKMAAREQENLREKRFQVLRDLRQAYYEYHLAYRTAEILEQNKDTMRNFLRIAETRYATGQAVQQDVLRAQIEVSMLLERIAMAEQKKEAGRAMINALVGRNPFDPLGRPGDKLKTSFDASLDKLADHATSHSPAVLGKQRMVEANEEELSLSKREYFPNMTLNAGWFTRGGHMEDVWQASIMFEVPLWFWNKTTGVKAAAAELGAARYEYEAQKLMVLSKVRDLFTMAKTSERLLGLYETGIIPQAKMAVQSSSSNYQVGKIDFLMLLDSQALLYRYQLAYEQELVNLNKTLAQIDELTGGGD